jgi:hypothetical protein
MSMRTLRVIAACAFGIAGASYHAAFADAAPPIAIHYSPAEHLDLIDAELINQASTSVDIADPAGYIEGLLKFRRAGYQRRIN